MRLGTKWLSVLIPVTAVSFFSCTSELKVGEGDLDLTITGRRRLAYDTSRLYEGDGNQ